MRFVVLASSIYAGIASSSMLGGDAVTPQDSSNDSSHMMLSSLQEKTADMVQKLMTGQVTPQDSEVTKLWRELAALEDENPQLGSQVHRLERILNDALGAQQADQTGAPNREDGRPSDRLLHLKEATGSMIVQLKSVSDISSLRPDLNMLWKELAALENENPGLGPEVHDLERNLNDAIKGMTKADANGEKHIAFHSVESDMRRVEPEWSDLPPTFPALTEDQIESFLEKKRVVLDMNGQEVPLETLIREKRPFAELRNIKGTLQGFQFKFTDDGRLGISRRFKFVKRHELVYM